MATEYNNIPPMSIEDLFKPPDHVVILKSTWWLTLAKQSLDQRLSIVKQDPKDPESKLFKLYARLRDRLELVNKELLSRAQSDQRDLPTIEIPKGGYHVDVSSD